jgi:predicted RNA-binding protein YlxR (DUF448 family)
MAVKSSDLAGPSAASPGAPRHGPGTRKRKHVPLRMCVACQQRHPKRELVRIVRGPAGTIDLDPAGKQPGRGAYLCSRPDCWQRALEPERLGRVLRCKVTAEDIARLREALERLELSDPGSGAAAVP